MQPGPYMLEALNLAREGMERGDGGPFGAVIVRDGQVIGRGWNKVLRTNDPTAHAEIVAIRDACSRTGSYWLEDAHIYVNCEPCPMCLAALYWAKIKYLTFGASREDAAKIDFDDAYIYQETCRPVEERSLITNRCGREKALKIMQLWPTFNQKQQY